MTTKQKSHYSSMLDIKIDQIAARKATLEAAKTHLKSQFIGIDGIIDDLLDYIQVWYLVPEILKRPVIVNLWGMTGVGKTDLVRKLIKSLDMTDRFVEVELSNADSTSWSSSVSAVLTEYGFQDEKPCIVLFDEIQRFNTVDEQGRQVSQTKYMDFWELLSDGHLSKRSKIDLDQYLHSYRFNQKDRQRRKEKGEETEAPNGIGIWEAQNLRRVLDADMAVDQMADLQEADVIEMIMAAKQKKKIYEPVNHAKTLIIISGNLDQAFSMAGQASEADIDADIFHAYTKKITVVDIKNALSSKFRPEQVARFGNIHLIYNSLRKQDFEQLIKREVERIQADAERALGIKLIVDKSIEQLIYRNGVFPVQGVRPVFSSIIDILESNLSKFLFEAIMTKSKIIDISYDQKAQKIIGKIGENVVEVPYIGRIDKIRQSNEADTVANISVHESGHAVVYMALLGMAPLQLKSKVASSYAAGFTFPHAVHQTKRSLINMAKVYLAGGIAEELIFGQMEASVGREHDRERATELILDYVRKYGFDDEFQANYTIDFYPHRMMMNETDTDVEKMMVRLVSETKELLNKHANLLRALSIELSLKGSMDAAEVASVAQKHRLNALIRPEGYFSVYGYDAAMRAPVEESI
jgi:Peptidase family M41/ATPase family associated with various cellular activities (AAA)